VADHGITDPVAVVVVDRLEVVDIHQGHRQGQTAGTQITEQ